MSLNQYFHRFAIGKYQQPTKDEVRYALAGLLMESMYKDLTTTKEDYTTAVNTIEFILRCLEGDSNFTDLKDTKE